jgi:NTE family protein
LKSSYRTILFLLIFFHVFTPVLCQQKVGLVLSGGGATALAHIGVLKALEERGIPINYITGTSAGAFVGALYASGYSPKEIEEYVLNPDFQLMTTGKLKPNQRFLVREEEQTASLINVLFTYNNLLKKSLPTSFTTSTYLDFEMLKTLGTTAASHHNDFDSLFVPFRCVSSDITHKKSVVFSKGNLNQAVRSSMTYPFYFSPLRIDNNLLFDGGLYNNFPADIMYSDFNPDYIIGSNVSYNAEPPSEDDLVSQITNMLVSHSDFTLPCEAGLIIRPITNVTTFSFENIEEAISDGYSSTLLYLDSIEARIQKKTSLEALELRRREFRSKVVPLNIQSISNKSSKRDYSYYAKKSLMNNKREKNLTLEQIEKRYFRLSTAQQIDFIFPTLSLKSDSTYDLNLEIRKAKDFKLDVGGHFSSRAVNTGFLSLAYRKLGKTATTLTANSYFGKFYGSIKGELTVEIPSRYPVSVSPYFVMNRWDYFHNFATFFEDVKPSFLIQNELYYGLKFTSPVGNTIKSTFDARFFSLEDNYYQTEDFTSKDTTDRTYFYGSSLSWQFLKNSLNRKQFASSGHYFSFRARFVNGIENTINGTTNTPFDVIKQHNWLNISSELQSFLIDKSFFHFGVHSKLIINSLSLFHNYTATLLSMSSFAPIADAETYFLPQYRSPQHIGLGTNFIFTVKKKIDIRIDTYYYQPLLKLIEDKTNGTFGYSKPFKGQTMMASASVIFHSFIGPLRASFNYFPLQTAPFAFQVSYGYVLFNERAIR